MRDGDALPKGHRSGYVVRCAVCGSTLPGRVLRPDNPDVRVTRGGPGLPVSSLLLSVYTCRGKCEAEAVRRLQPPPAVNAGATPPGERSATDVNGETEPQDAETPRPFPSLPTRGSRK